MMYVTHLVQVTGTSVLHGLNIETVQTYMVDDVNEKCQFHISSAKCVIE